MEILPNGKVKLDDGQIIERHQVAYQLRSHPTQDNVYGDHKGQCYYKDSKGTLRKMKILKSDNEQASETTESKIIISMPRATGSLIIPVNKTLGKF
jgi:hypothetical protein